MTEDNILLLACYIINWITLSIVVIYSANKKQSVLIHLGIQTLYSLYWWYQLTYNSGGGAALVTWFLWMLTVGIHWFGSLTHLGVIRWKRRK
jgi:hypothetical protein